MLFKENILLANCDSTRALSTKELQKRILIGTLFGRGVIVSPNILIDNPGIPEVLDRPNIAKYLREEGQGSFVVRGFNVGSDFSILEYFEKLPDSYILSSLAGRPCKGDLKYLERDSLKWRLERLQRSLEAIRLRAQPVEVSPDSLTREIKRRLTADSAGQYYFGSQSNLDTFLEGSEHCVSRSDWYSRIEQYSADHWRLGGDSAAAFKLEVVDPAYNSLFIHKGETFVQDNIRVIERFPVALLNAGAHIKSLRREMSLLSYSYRLFELVSSLAVGDLARYLTEEALDYVESKAIDHGYEKLARKNWFGLYPKMRQYMGVEIKE